MKIKELLQETVLQKGTYAGVRFDEETKKALHEYIKKHKIPNSPRPDKFHTTLLYSRKHCPNYKPLGKFPKPLKGKTTGLEVWKTQDGKNALVLKYECKELSDRHNDLMKEHGATYDYPKYKTHVTFSYDIGDTNHTTFDDVTKAVPWINIVDEYGEDLDLNWAKTRGTKRK